MLLGFVGLLEVSVKHTLKRLAVTSFVACHFMYGIVDCVESVLLCAGCKVELTCCCFCVLLAEIFSFSCLLCLYIILQTMKGGCIMFPKQRLATRAICERISFELQVYMWHCIDALEVEQDYLQVFRLFNKDGKQMMVHEQEVPPYKKEYLLVGYEPIDAKIFVINDGDYATMLFAEEY